MFSPFCVWVPLSLFFSFLTLVLWLWNSWKEYTDFVSDKNRPWWLDCHSPLSYLKHRSVLLPTDSNSADCVWAHRSVHCRGVAEGDNTQWQSLIKLNSKREVPFLKEWSTLTVLQWISFTTQWHWFVSCNLKLQTNLEGVFLWLAKEKTVCVENLNTVVVWPSSRVQHPALAS